MRRNLIVIFAVCIKLCLQAESLPEQKNILITGVAGFIGFHLANHLIDKGYQVYGCDNLNSYYSVDLKRKRLEMLEEKGLHFFPIDIQDIDQLSDLFNRVQFKELVHLAAQPGVRLSITNPRIYLKSNVDGFLEILEFCKKNPEVRLIYASSSSVYGDTKGFPQHEEMNLSCPNSLYSATKIANELFARVYENVFGLKTVGMRFFTVYGPWGRPDMAYFTFADAIVSGRELTLYENGNLWRDFTYIDDIIDGIIRIIDSDCTSGVFNLGKGTPDKVRNLVYFLEEEFGKTALIVNAPLHSADVRKTYADVSKADRELGYTPKVDLKSGISKFVSWYKEFYK